MTSAAAVQGLPPSLSVMIGAPRLFTWRALALIHLCSLLLVLPVLVSMAALTLVGFGWASLLLPLFAFAITVLFLPLGFGNPYVKSLVKRFAGDTAQSSPGWVVQVSLLPRLRSGLRAAMEDADDVGWLAISHSALLFTGDSVKLRIPATSIIEVRLKNVGLRGMFLYGQRVVVGVKTPSGAITVEFAERSSSFLGGSRSITRNIYQNLRSATRSENEAP